MTQLRGNERKCSQCNRRCRPPHTECSAHRPKPERKPKPSDGPGPRAIYAERRKRKRILNSVPPGWETA